MAESGLIDAQDVRYVGLSSDGRANVYEWKCGRCGTKGDRVDDFLCVVRAVQCPRSSCLAENRIVMGRKAQ